MKRVTANVKGRVQGVSFRYYTRQEARRLNLTGWVRNEPDGSVTVVAEGTQDQLERLQSFLSRGPYGARVDNLQINWSRAINEFDSFEIRLI